MGKKEHCMTEFAKEFQRRAAEERRRLLQLVPQARYIGDLATPGASNAPALSPLNTGQDELLLGLPRRPERRPRGLRMFANAMREKGLPIEEVRPDDRPLLAHYAYEYIMDGLYERNEQRIANQEKPYLLSPVHAHVPVNLNKYYVTYYTSLNGQEGPRMRERRLAELERDTATARTHLRMPYADLAIAEAIQRSMQDFYPDTPASDATTELLAAYGTGRARISFMPQPRPEPTAPPDRNYGIPDMPPD
jgi:hypothetical protein